MKNLLLIMINYLLIYLISTIGYFKIISFDLFADLGLFLFHYIPEAFDQNSGMAYNPMRAIWFILHLSIIPFLLGFIKNNKRLVYFLSLYLLIEIIYIAATTAIMGA